MPIVEVNGQELEFPDDMTPEAIKGVLQAKFPKPEPSYDKRIDNTALAIDEYKTGKTGPTQAGFRVLGQGLGVINDKIAEAIPQTVKDTAGFVYSANRDYNPLVSPALRALEQAGGSAASKYNDFAKDNPGRALDLSAAGNLAGVASLIVPGPRAVTATTNAAATGAGSLIGAAADKAALRMAKNSGEIAAKNSPISKVYARLVADHGEEGARKILNSYASTQGKSLVETGGARTANLAEGAAQYPSGGAKATEFFDDAVGRAPEKLKGSLGKTISPEANYYDTADKIVDEGRAKVAPFYSKAFQANQQIESPIISRILETPEGRSALGDAARNMQNEMALLSKADPELTALANEAGMMSTGQGVGKGLKLRTLDYVKRSMDDTIRQARRAGDEGQERRITQLKNGLLNEMDSADKTKLYAKARKESGDYLSATDALEQGTRFLQDDSQLIKRNYGLMGPTEKKAYKAGVLKSMREQIENTVDGANVARIFKKPATREKLGAILSPKEYGKLMNDAMATDNIYKLRNQIVGNSRTAGRQIAAEEFTDGGAELIDDLLNKGAKRTAGTRVIKWVSKRFDGLSDKSAADVANILYETDPQTKYKIVKDLSNLARMNNPRGTQAAQQLKAFYSISDALKARGTSTPIKKAP